MSISYSMPEFLSLREAVRENIASGDMAAFEGFTHLIPYAAAHEVIRAGFTGLTVVRMTPDVIYDQLIGMGRVRKMIFSYAGNPGVGLLRRFRDAVEKGWPERIMIEEHSHAALANAYASGASGLPCAVFRGYQGAELTEVNQNIRHVECPFTGESLAAVPSINPDVTFIHAQQADRKGNVLLEGILGVQKEAVLAARRAVVTVEQIVENLDAHPNACVLPAWTISAICQVPGGAHPSYAHGHYRRDNAFYRQWDRIAADRQLFCQWMEQHVIEEDPSVFVSRAGGAGLRQ